MKPALITFSAIVFSFFYSCNTNNKSNNEPSEVEATDTVYDNPEDAGNDSLMYVKNQTLLWQIQDTGSFKLKKPLVQGIDTMSAQGIIDLINSNYDSVHVDYVKTSHDTIYVHIPNSDMLTERMGSTGAQMFMAATTFSLTELKGIKYVNYDFIEGAHAAPGVYDRSYFKSFQ